MFIRNVFCFIRCLKSGQRVAGKKYACTITRVQQKSNCLPGAYKFLPGFSLLGFWSYGGKKKEEALLVTNVIDSVVELADFLCERGNFKRAYQELNKYRKSNNVEILWRLSSVLYSLSRTATSVEAQKMILEGYDILNEALANYPDHYAVNKWMAVLLNSKSNLEGMGVRMRELYNIKNFLMKAAELNPKDSTIFCLLGNLCYEIASLPWYQKKIVTIVYGDLPPANFAEALMYFKKAKQIGAPCSFNQVHLMLGKTYLKMNDINTALTYLDMVVKCHAKNDQDLEAISEAQELINNIK